MVSVKMLPQPGAKLDLTQIHNSVHNLVLSRRKDIGFWTEPFETAWAGFIFAGHSMSNRDDMSINFIKGELLGNKRPTYPSDASELAACFMTSAFLERINLHELAKGFLTLADSRAMQITANIDLGGRFHLFSSPEYLYAIIQAHHIMQQRMADEIADKVLSALERIQQADWYQSGYVFALAGTAYLIVNDYPANACHAMLHWLNPRLERQTIDEYAISYVWFLENNWPRIKPNISNVQRKNIHKAFIQFRSKLLHSLGHFDFQLAWNPPMEVEYDEPISDSLVVVSTIELLMLDEIAETHCQLSFVVTQDELDQYSLLSSAFEQYKRLVDDKLAIIGLGDELDAVYKGLVDDNPASWQNAILGCRNVLYGLSKTLWKVVGDEYKLPDGTHLPVKPDKEKNRLHAYLAYWGVSKNKQPIVSTEFNAVISLMRAYIDKSAKAKYAITKEEAFSLVMALYILLGEMIALTDLKPAT